ncbi:hypothetical protein Btru_019568 [Bulinus truncatus]|nr:hypothetical protein Btru_019568 [Bulinus truncatus]
MITVSLSEASSIINALTHNRCEKSTCADPPQGCVAYATKNELNCPITCTYSCGAPWCLARTCVEYCPGGYIKDNMGCNTCDCRPPCDQRRCWLPCPSGHLRDKSGCKTCACAALSTQPPYVMDTSKPSSDKGSTTKENIPSPSTDATTSSNAETTTSQSVYCILSSEPTTNIPSK